MYNPTLRVHLIDTPGFDDTNLSDVQILQNIAHWLSMSFKHGIKLSGIIFLHRIIDVRMAVSARRNLLMFQKLCGEKCYSSVVLATTMWSKVDEETGSAREEELINTDEWWGHMYKKGSKIFRYTGGITGSKESTMAIVKYILSLHTTVTLDIQDEIVNHGQDIDDTAAARELNADIIRERKKHQAELEAMRQQMKEAMEEHNEELQRVFKEEHDLLQAKIDKSAEEQFRLKQTLEEVHKRKEEEFRAFKAELQAERERERQKYESDRRTLEEDFKRQQQVLEKQQQRELQRMETATREERERRDDEMRRQMEEQKMAQNQRLEELQEESTRRERRFQDQLESKINSKRPRRIVCKFHHCC
jgi:hypothetical protein